MILSGSFNGSCSCSLWGKSGLLLIEMPDNHLFCIKMVMADAGGNAITINIK